MVDLNEFDVWRTTIYVKKGYQERTIKYCKKTGIGVARFIGNAIVMLLDKETKNGK